VAAVAEGLGLRVAAAAQGDLVLAAGVEGLAGSVHEIDEAFDEVGAV
jgi:hypothetical protein